MVREEAVKYIKSLNNNDRKQLKIMLENNIVCCKGYAEDLSINIDDFNSELRRILEIDEQL